MLALILLAGCLSVSAEDLTLTEQFRFDTAYPGQQAVYSDGEYIWTASWQDDPEGGHTFYKYELDGTFIEGFDIGGVRGVSNFASDGTNVWCSNGGNRPYKVDLNAKTLLDTLVTEVSAIRHCTCDPTDGGFWVGDWNDLNKIDAQGKKVFTAAALCIVITKKKANN